MTRFFSRGSLTVLLLLGGCTSLSDLTELGHPPRMTHTSDPTQSPDYRPVTMPMPPLQPPPTEVGSLWRSGSRAFFKDQRASQVGDLITINVNISDNAALNDNTTVAGSGSQTFGIPSFFGAQGKVLSSSSALDTSSATANTGAGVIRRNETVTLALAGTVTQVLPNGNFVVVARQEVRINGELRQLMVSGVVRPQDITEDNIVTHDRIAEARISYGGRGQLTTVQNARWGQQIMNGVLPF
ncbi:MULTISPECIES: flagellar basal body L-ring protein FlgH [Asaia]|uniref:Flagellar L-ring protein n=2 Tax=Asaia TaxID=91914 RepID=A0AAN4U156_9PROT|nr:MULTISPECIES: flagellar basal body L-ring protein FlgH [Asaia]MCO6160043.1 flagellar basal body L-ring protein FlgH [Asaia lannensis NBRC 102526]NIE79492.1 flagellar basal body L-ring protein FlgH [Asaia sp. As-1742]BAT20530.1 flagellar basal body L-ring protein [Asaia bogorensis NBRC 16594]GBQ79022.1 flagellar basal body L-ring protein [Asaia bogorensis NBRC 16594]GEL52046.1 flagellar L-ring protein 1 [Asaia bogorensis NBRC 16594]